MDAMESLARAVANRSSGFVTQTMKRITASSARLAGNFWQIEVFRGS